MLLKSSPKILWLLKLPSLYLQICTAMRLISWLLLQSTMPAAKRKLLQTMMVNLIKSVGEKMKGFSKKETVAFYQDIMNRAWEQVEQAATPEVKGQVYEDVMDWTMLDKNYDKRTNQTFSGPIFIPAPIWWWRYDSSFPRAGDMPAASAGGMPISAVEKSQCQACLDLRLQRQW